MATGRKTVIVGQVIDPDTWGNPLWDQSVQTFASPADRTAQFAAPKQGAVSYLEDVKRFEGFNGTKWLPILVGQSFSVSKALDVSGLASYPHTLGVSPSFASFQVSAGTTDDITALMGAVVLWGRDANQVSFRFVRADTHTWFGTVPVIGGVVTVFA